MTLKEFRELTKDIPDDTKIYSWFRYVGWKEINNLEYEVHKEASFCKKCINLNFYK